MQIIQMAVLKQAIQEPVHKSHGQMFHGMNIHTYIYIYIHACHQTHTEAHAEARLYFIVFSGTSPYKWHRSQLFRL